MRTFTVNLQTEGYVLKDTITKEVINANRAKGLTAAREQLKDQIFHEILKRKMI